MAPIPGQQVGDLLGGMIGQSGQDIGEPGLRVDVVELGGFDQGVDGSGAPAAFVWVQLWRTLTRRERTVTSVQRFGPIVRVRRVQAAESSTTHPFGAHLMISIAILFARPVSHRPSPIRIVIVLSGSKN